MLPTCMSFDNCTERQITVIQRANGEQRELQDGWSDTQPRVPIPSLHGEQWLGFTYVHTTTTTILQTHKEDSHK